MICYTSLTINKAQLSLVNKIMIDEYCYEENIEEVYHDC